MNKKTTSSPKTGAPSYTDFLVGLFLATALWFIPNGSESEALNTFGIVFVSIVLEAIPFMLVGSLVGGLIESFVSRERMTSILPRKGWLTVCAAAGAGVLFPVCECAVVPVVRRLIKKGLPAPAAVAYLLGGPIVNPIVAASTTMAYGMDWRVAAVRIALGYGIAVVVGLLVGRLFPKDEILLPEYPIQQMDHAYGCGSHCGILQPGLGPMAPTHVEESGHCDCGCLEAAGERWTGRIWAALRHAGNDFLAVGHYLIIGAFIAALAQTYIDRSTFMGLAETPGLSVGLMILLAILLNLCSEADAFIAASFRGLIPFPAQMAFMLTGPMFDIKLLLMYRRLFKPRAIVVLAVLILASVLIVSLCFEWLGGLGL
jgi:uncharacterized membrane protein YraQ (UPF0718 family)